MQQRDVCVMRVLVGCSTTAHSIRPDCKQRTTVTNRSIRRHKIASKKGASYHKTRTQKWLPACAAQPTANACVRACVDAFEVCACLFPSICVRANEEPYNVRGEDTHVVVPIKHNHNQTRQQRQHPNGCDVGRWMATLNGMVGQSKHQQRKVS